MPQQLSAVLLQKLHVASIVAQAFGRGLRLLIARFRRRFGSNTEHIRDVIRMPFAIRQGLRALGARPFAR